MTTTPHPTSHAHPGPRRLPAYFLGRPVERYAERYRRPGPTPELARAA